MHISCEKAKKNENAIKLTAEVKERLFSTAFSTEFLFPETLALLMAGISDDETATSTDDGNCIRGIAMPVSEPKSDSEFTDDEKRLSLEGISTFSTAERSDADILVSVRGSAMAMTFAIEIPAEDVALNGGFVCLRKISVSRNESISPMATPVTAAAQAYSIPFEKKNGYSINTTATLIICSKT